MITSVRKRCSLFQSVGVDKKITVLVSSLSLKGITEVISFQGLFPRLTGSNSVHNYGLGWCRRFLHPERQV